MLVLLLAIGAGGGFGASLAVGENPPGSGPAGPVVAQSPSLPIDPAPSLLPDAAVPPLAVDLPMHRVTRGVPGFAITYPVPRGWTETRSANDAKWRPPVSVDFGYLLRVEQVAQNRSIARTMEDRIRDLGLDEERFTLIARTSDTLAFTYVDRLHQRQGYVRWLDLSSGFADVEVAVTGRIVDAPGMEWLLDRVSDGVEQG